jgi:hypothetical protein
MSDLTAEFLAQEKQADSLNHMEAKFYHNQGFCQLIFVCRLCEHPSRPAKKNAAFPRPGDGKERGRGPG